MNEENKNIPEKPLNSSETNSQDQPKLTRIQRESYYAGPLPHPQALKQYEDVSEGMADRIVSMAENEAKHRHAKETNIIDLEYGNSRLGLWFGLAIGLFTIGCGTLCIMTGHEYSGTILGTAGLSGLVSAFVIGSKRSTEKEKQKKVGNENHTNKKGEEQLSFDL